MGSRHGGRWSNYKFATQSWFLWVHVDQSRRGQHEKTMQVCIDYWIQGDPGDVPENVFRQLLTCGVVVKDLRSSRSSQLLWESVLGGALHLSAVFPLTHRASSSARVLKNGSCPSSRRFFFSSFSKHLNHKWSETQLHPWKFQGTRSLLFGTFYVDNRVPREK